MLRMASPERWRPSVPELSVVIPTRDRAEKLRRTVEGLRAQDLEQSRFEILVVDDGSDPPVSPEQLGETPNLRVHRLTHGERSRARNAGAEQAKGSILLFVDDDMRVGSTTLRAHLAAQEEWPGVLAVGAIRLPEPMLRTPFGRFRQVLETAEVPVVRGPSGLPNFAAAGNMSIARARFLELGGFDHSLVSSEDQDFALRHTAAGGGIVFLPEAIAVHDDAATTLRSYCARTEWGAEHLGPFCTRYRHRPENRRRFEVNGPVRWRVDPPARILRKLCKGMLAQPWPLSALLGVTEVLEKLRPSSRLLPGFYRLCIGVHLQRGFRRGWAQDPNALVEWDTGP